jgi:RNA recognition motif-containing protein
MAKRIYVDNLARGVTNEDLRKLFGQYGEVVLAHVASNCENGSADGFGVVEMKNDQEADNAIQALNGSMHKDRALAINPGEKLPPEFLEWARQQYTEEEILAGVREVRESGGLELKDFIHEIDDILSPND